MRPLLFLACFFVSLTALAQSKSAGDDEPEGIILGFRGKSKYQIVVPDTAANEAEESSIARSVPAGCRR